VNLFNRVSMPIPIHHCEPFVIPEDPALPDAPGTVQAAFILGHPRTAASPPLRRLARKILGRAVGMAVGGGAAFGIAHVGVIKVFEENDIPIDLVAGTSMGSIVAIGYAAGISGAEMLDIAGRIGTKLMTLSALDFTITKPGLLAGNRLVKIFSPLLGPVKRFDQLRYPCRAVAADIESGEAIPICDGRLDHAFRASSSVPMLWSPVRHEGRVVVDGGMIDPVPAEMVRAMGADLCIAVNVVPPLKRGVDNALTRLLRRLNWLNPLAYLGDSRTLPNTFDVIMNSIQMLQHELGNYKAVSADVRITPDLSEFTWIEFYRPLEIIERGATAAREALPAIKRALAEQRSAAARP
jgi:NTE family protein